MSEATPRGFRPLVVTLILASLVGLYGVWELGAAFYVGGLWMALTLTGLVGIAERIWPLKRSRRDPRLDRECVEFGPVVADGKAVPVRCVDTRCFLIGKCARRDDG